MRWTRITRGTTNVFADLGNPDAAEWQTRTRQSLAVNEMLKAPTNWHSLDELK